MAFIPFPNTAEVAMRFTQDQQQVENVYHVLVADPSDVSELIAVGIIFVDWWVAQLKAVSPPTLTLRDVAVKGLASESDPTVDDTGGLPQSGTGAVQALPNNVTIAVKWGTGLGGRSQRGRTYHLGLSEGQVTNNQVDPTPLGSLVTIYDDLRSRCTAASHDLVVASRFHNKAPRAIGQTTVITSVSIEPTIDSQRRRLPGRGR